MSGRRGAGIHVSGAICIGISRAVVVGRRSTRAAVCRICGRLTRHAVILRGRLIRPLLILVRALLRLIRPLLILIAALLILKLPLLSVLPRLQLSIAELRHWSATAFEAL